MPVLEPVPPTAPSRSPGWYPDPVTDGRTDRWWTGAGWSGYSRPHAVAAVLPPGMVDLSIRRRNSTALLSMLLGLVALLLAVASVLGGSHIWVSWSGVAAVVLGIRAVRLRERGLATALVPALLGALSGGFATLVMVALLLVPTTTTRPVLDDPGGLGVQSDQALPSRVPSADPNAAQPRASLPDDALDSYSDVEIGSVTTASARCGVLRSDLVAFGIGDGQGSEAKRMQDFADLQVGAWRSVLLDRLKTSTPSAWPSSIDVDPQTRVVYLPAPACVPLGVLPKGDELHYAMSPDKGQIAVAVWNAQYRTGRLWRSVDDTDYPL